MKKYLPLIALNCFFLFVSCAEEPRSLFIRANNFITLDLKVRVLLTTADVLKIVPENPYILETTNESFMTDKALEIVHQPNGFFINGISYKTPKISAKGLRSFILNGQRYRGSYTVISVSNTLMLVNDVNIEEYLYSVVPKEIYPSWNKETLKSQAIASRTYALYEVKHSTSSPYFDLYSDTRSQVYLGVQAEHPVVTEIVNSTAGLVLTFNGDIIKSYFHSSSGGSISSGVEIFDKAPYLQQSSSYIAENDPSVSWEHKVNIKDIQKLYKMAYTPIDISVLNQLPSGRIDKVRIKDSNGNIVRTDGYTLRKNLGQAYMKSTYARISTIDDKGFFTISGQGYGHGVGMGQWDAEAMARQGFKYDSILAFFYKGSAVKSLY